MARNFCTSTQKRLTGWGKRYSAVWRPSSLASMAPASIEAKRAPASADMASDCVA